MGMTLRKRKFAAAVIDGLTYKDAAIIAGCSAATAEAAGSRMAKDPDVLAEVERKQAVAKAKEQARAEGRSLSLPDLSKAYDDPQEFLNAVMNDPGEDMKYRIEAAKTLMPFTHQKKGESGKKEQKTESAKAAASKFRRASPPMPATATRTEH